MKTEKIKPIPQYILKRVQKLDKKRYPNPDGHLRFYSYLSKNDKELVQIFVAVRHYKNNWLYKQVAIHGIHSDKCFVKDIYYNYIGGYVVGWYEQGVTKLPKWFESEEWLYSDDKYFSPYAPIVNKEYLDKTEYKYSGYQHFDNCKILKLLRLYEQYPQVELLIKMNLQYLAMSLQILKLTSKDKGFRKWLFQNRERLSKLQYYVYTVIEAYKTGKDIDKLHSFYRAKYNLCHDEHLNGLVSFFNKDLEKFFAYLTEQRISARLYKDYLDACNHLGLDMTLSKNRYPHDFKRWHDIRINEYAEAKARENAEKEAKLYADFGLVADKYRSLELKHKVYMVLYLTLQLT